MQAALNAANAGTHALESAANSISGVVADLDTMIIFASAGTLEADEEGDSFAGLFIKSFNLYIKTSIFYFQDTPLLRLTRSQPDLLTARL